MNEIYYSQLRLKNKRCKVFADLGNVLKLILVAQYSSVSLLEIQATIMEVNYG